MLMSDHGLISSSLPNTCGIICREAQEVFTQRKIDNDGLNHAANSFKVAAQSLKEVMIPILSYFYIKSCMHAFVI